MLERTHLAFDYDDHPDKQVYGLQVKRLNDLVKSAAEVIVDEWEIPEDKHLLRSAGAYREKVHAYLADQECRGVRMPWPKTHGRLQLREHETTLWFGYKKSYKSTILNELMTALACQGVPVAMASFEMPAYLLAALSVRQALAKKDPSPYEIDVAIDRLAESLVIYDVMGKVSPRHMLAIMRYCALALGCRQFVLDNLTRLLPAGNENFDVHQDFVQKVMLIANSTGMHQHLVAHCRKPENGDVSEPPNSYQVRGTGAVADMVDNLNSVWRNLPKEDELDGKPADKKHGSRLEEPDVILTCEFQRFWDFRGGLKYWIDRDTLRFCEGASRDKEPFISV